MKLKPALCNSDCNHCPIIGHPNNRLLTKLLNQLLARFGNGVYELVQNACPNPPSASTAASTTSSTTWAANSPQPTRHRHPASSLPHHPPTRRPRAKRSQCRPSTLSTHP